ncbi:MAG: MFS transporter [Rhodobacterales bacterium 34-62-10]|nr:MAG: MFS transporter [Rhodobacterales bacterium 34-62-10]
MATRYIPLWTRFTPAPGVRGFATLQGFEAITRGILVSVFPLEMYRALQDAQTVSQVYFMIGITSLIAGLMVPWLNRFLPRRWMYTSGACLYVLGSGISIFGGTEMIMFALLCNTLATVITFVCFNAYVLDYISRADLGRAESMRMFYSALGWTVGPVLGVTLMALWRPAPFVVAGISAMCMLSVFWVMRLGNGKLISRARAPAPNPLAFLARFFAQPRLIAGWLFAVIRSCGWWVYVVYLPIFAVEAGLGESTGGIVLSLTNGTLFLTPLMLRFVQASSIRTAVRFGFFASGGLFVLAGIGQWLPWGAVGALMAASLCLILLDVCGGLPFLMAVKPSERTEMSAVYSSFRDVSGILTPGVAWLVLLVAPLPGVFMACGAGLWLAWGIAGRLHPRLGRARLRLPAI